MEQAVRRLGDKEMGGHAMQPLQRKVGNEVMIGSCMAQAFLRHIHGKGTPVSL